MLYKGGNMDDNLKYQYYTWDLELIHPDALKEDAADGRKEGWHHLGRQLQSLGCMLDLMVDSILAFLPILKSPREFLLNPDS